MLARLYLLRLGQGELSCAFFFSFRCDTAEPCGFPHGDVYLSAHALSRTSFLLHGNRFVSEARILDTSHRKIRSDLAYTRVQLSHTSAYVSLCIHQLCALARPVALVFPLARPLWFYYHV